MCETALFLLKEKIIKTDAVINLLADKNYKVTQLQQKLKFLFDRYVEKTKESELLHQEMCVCKSEHTPLKLRITELECQYSDLQMRYDKYLNISEVKVQTANEELMSVLRKNQNLLKVNAKLKEKLKVSKYVYSENKNSNFQVDEMKVLKLENETLSTHLDKLMQRCDRESKELQMLRLRCNQSDTNDVGTIKNVSCSKEVQTEPENKHFKEIFTLKGRISKLEVTERQLRKEIEILKMERKTLGDQLSEVQLEKNLLNDSLEAYVGLCKKKRIRSDSTQTEIDHDVKCYKDDIESDVESVEELLREMIDLPDPLAPLNDTISCYDEADEECPNNFNASCSSKQIENYTDLNTSQIIMPLPKPETPEHKGVSMASQKQLLETCDIRIGSIGTEVEYQKHMSYETYVKCIRTSTPDLPNSEKLPPRITTVDSARSHLIKKKRLAIRKKRALRQTIIIKRLRDTLRRDLFRALVKYFHYVKVPNITTDKPPKSQLYKKNEKLLRLKVEKLRELCATSEVDSEPGDGVTRLRKFMGKPNYRNINTGRRKRFSKEKCESGADNAALSGVKCSGSDSISLASSAELKKNNETITEDKTEKTGDSGFCSEKSNSEKNICIKTDLQTIKDTGKAQTTSKVCVTSEHTAFLQERTEEKLVEVGNLKSNSKNDKNIAKSNEGIADNENERTRCVESTRDYCQRDLSCQITQNRGTAENGLQNVKHLVDCKSRKLSEVSQTAHIHRKRKLDSVKSQNNNEEFRDTTGDYASLEDISAGDKRRNLNVRVTCKEINKDQEGIEDEREVVTSPTDKRQLLVDLFGSGSDSDDSDLSPVAEHTDLSISECKQFDVKTKIATNSKKDTVDVNSRKHEKQVILSKVESSESVHQNVSDCCRPDMLCIYNNPQSPEHQTEFVSGIQFVPQIIPLEKVEDISLDPKHCRIVQYLNPAMSDEQFMSQPSCKLTLHIVSNMCTLENSEAENTNLARADSSNCDKDLHLDILENPKSPKDIMEHHDNLPNVSHLCAYNLRQSKRTFKRPNCTKAAAAKHSKLPSDVHGLDVVPQGEGKVSLSCAVAPLLSKQVQRILPSTARQLFKKILNFGNEATVIDEAAGRFVGQNTEHVASLILSEVRLYLTDEVDCKYTPPAPVLTQTQRLLLGFMCKLDSSCNAGLLDCFMSMAEHSLLTETNLSYVQPTARLYLGVCKVKKDLDRMRRMICDALYFMGDFAVPFLFTVLSTWFEVLPLQINAAEDCLVKVLIQVVNLKTCNTPGYNLLSLRNLLNLYYGYPTERWNSDEVFQEIFQYYLADPSKLNEYAILILCKNHPAKWVLQQINTHIKQAVMNSESVHLKIKIVRLVECIASQFKNVDDEIALKDVQIWLEMFLHDDMPT